MSEENQINENETSKNTFTQKKNYCHICCKYFKTKGSHKQHMNSFHDEAAVFKIPNSSNILFKPDYKPTNIKYWFDPKDVFIEYFEKEMTSDFKNGNDKFRCLSCHFNFANGTEYMEHEIIHYRPSNVKNKVHVNKEASFQQDFGDSLMTDDPNGIKCVVSEKMFTTKTDFDENKNKNCKNDKHIEHVNSIKSKGNDEQSIPQKFNCYICKQMCECLEHLELNKWWAGSNIQNEFRCYECSVCSKQFFEEKEFKIHQKDHPLVTP